MDGFAVDTQELRGYSVLLNNALSNLERAILQIDGNLICLAKAGYPRQWLQEIADSKKKLEQERDELRILFRLLREIAACYDKAEAANKLLIDELGSLAYQMRGGSVRNGPMPGVVYSHRINPVMAHESWLLAMAIQNAQDEAVKNDD